MKIVFFVTYYYPHWTGLTQHAKSVAEGLEKNGHSIRVLAAQHEPTLARREVLGEWIFGELQYCFGSPGL